MMGMAAAVAVSIGYASYTPHTVDVVRGEHVTWSQDSVRKHTVTARDGSWDSGALASGETFERRFDDAGPQPYYCRLHAGITGVVDVREVVLDEPRQAASSGRPFPLSGRAASGVRTVTVTGDDGTEVQAPVRDDGTFTAAVTPAATTTYRAADSAPVTLRVLDRRVLVRVLPRSDGRWSVVAVVSPASPRAHVVLQLRLRHRFGWWPVGFGRLGGDSATTLRVRRVRPVRARVLLTLPDRASPLAVSRTFRLGRPRPTAPPAPHAHASTS